MGSRKPGVPSAPGATERSPPEDRVPLAPTLFGRLLIISLNPDRLRKVRTAKVFAPTLSVIADILEYTSLEAETWRLNQAPFES
ncbi:MAG: hypothetical protein HGA45_08015 [Chloroflexales bacterium]|nr:hypothetical protein [Chloroflexales bacterium]